MLTNPPYPLPLGLIGKNLDLKRGGNRYIKTAAYGHFGRDDTDVFTWVSWRGCPGPRGEGTGEAGEGGGERGRERGGL